jgi:hypothetical protein
MNTENGGGVEKARKNDLHISLPLNNGSANSSSEKRPLTPELQPATASMNIETDSSGLPAQ